MIGVTTLMRRRRSLLPAAYRLRIIRMCVSMNGSRGRAVIQLYSHTFWQERTTVVWNSCNVDV